MKKYLLSILIVCFVNIGASIEVDQATSAVIQMNPDDFLIQGTVRREIVAVRFEGPLEEGSPWTMLLKANWILTVDQQKFQQTVSYLQEIVPLMHPDNTFENQEILSEYTILKTSSWHMLRYVSYDDIMRKWEDDLLINFKIKNIVVDGDQWLLELDLDAIFKQIKDFYKLQPYDIYQWPASIKIGDACWKLWTGHPDEYKPIPYPYILILHHLQ